VNHGRRGIPDFDYVPGTINFIRDATFPNGAGGSNRQTEAGPAPASFLPFQGTGQLLRPAGPTAMTPKRARTDDTPEDVEPQ